MSIIGVLGQSQSGKDLTTRIIQLLTANYSNEEILDILFKSGDYNLLPFSDETSWENKKFAGKLKEIVSILTGLSIYDLEKQEIKEKELGEEWNKWYITYFDGYYSYDKYFNTKLEADNFTERLDCLVICQPTLEILTPRKLLQLLGTECGRQIIHPSIWINALFSDYKPNGAIKSPRYGTFKEKVSNNDWEYIDCPNWIISDVRFLNEVKAIKSRGGITIKKSGKEISNSTHISETELLNYQADYILDWYDDIKDLIEAVKIILIKESIIK